MQWKKARYAWVQDSLLGHEQHGHDFVDAAEPAGVDLAVVDRARLEELLEHDAVLAVLAGGDADAVRLEGLSDGRVAEDVVWRGRLFDEAEEAR